MKNNTPVGEKWEKEYQDIQNEYSVHRNANQCPICDSPQGHRSMKDFISNLLSQAKQEAYKNGRQSILDEQKADQEKLLRGFGKE